MARAMLCLLLAVGPVLADGKVFRPREYKGSLEEQSQEAIIIYTPGADGKPAMEDLILKIAVKGEVDRFAWVVPFPNEPQVAKEEAQLFQELFAYVEARKAEQATKKGKSTFAAVGSKAEDNKPVEVLQRQVVGSYDVAVVRENEAGALNRWLTQEGFQALGDDAEDVLGFYRQQRSVFACIKVKDATPNEKKYIELHPLRFTFEPGRAEGIYFPMKLTGLQDDPFRVTLYVFHRWWIDDHQSEQGYEQRGFRLDYRDWDSSGCTPNAGKAWSAPASDVFLQSKAHLLPATTQLFQTLHPGQRYYLTRIQGEFQPRDVRQWADDLWLQSYRVSAVQRAKPWLLGGGVILFALLATLLVWKIQRGKLATQG